MEDVEYDVGMDFVDGGAIVIAKVIRKQLNGLWKEKRQINFDRVISIVVERRIIRIELLIYFIPLELLEYNRKVDSRLDLELVKVENFYFR